MNLDTIQTWAFRIALLSVGVAFYVAFRFY